MNKISTNFLKYGYHIFDIENTFNLLVFKELIHKSLNYEGELSKLHLSIDSENLNNLRLNAFRSINSLECWQEKYYSLAEIVLTELFGYDISIQNKLNLSIQIPNDNTSQLMLHTDTLSGQTEYEVVLWVPFTNVYDSNGMYLIDKNCSREIFSSLPKYEKKGMSAVYEEFKHLANFIKIDFGKAIIFSPTLFHGNIINKTDSSRISINCRFKSLFSPEFEGFPTERSTGPFYRPLKYSAVTEYALSYDEGSVIF